MLPSWRCRHGKVTCLVAERDKGIERLGERAVEHALGFTAASPRARRLSGPDRQGQEGL
ncbi:hypothetical protein ACFQU7_32530 [Pseudoroseomonas wenyumeiae]